MLSQTGQFDHDRLKFNYDLSTFALYPSNSSILKSPRPNWFSVQKSDPLFVIEQNNHNREFAKISKSFLVSYRENLHNLSEFSFDLISDSFERLVSEVLDYKPITLSTSFTLDKSLYVKSRFFDENYHFEIFFEDEIDVALNIYKNKKCQKAIYGSLEVVLQEVKELRTFNEEYFSQTAREISRKTFTQSSIPLNRRNSVSFDEISNSNYRDKEVIY